MPPRNQQSDKPKVTLYHSELVHVGGPVKITVLSEAKQSKFKGKPDYVELMYDGEKRQYWLDNPNLAAFFEGQVGRTMSIIAEGHKGDEVLTFVGDAVPETARAGKSTRPAPKQAGNRPPPRTEAPPARDEGTYHEEHTPPRETSEDVSARYEAAILAVKQAAGRETVLAAICCDAAECVAKRHESKHGKIMAEERIQGIAMRMMITLAPKAAALPTNLEKWLPVVKVIEPSDNDGTQK